jgi:hypothetical protein
MKPGFGVSGCAACLRRGNARAAIGAALPGA